MIIIKDCVRWSSVYSWQDIRLQGGTGLNPGPLDQQPRLNLYCATEAPVDNEQTAPKQEVLSKLCKGDFSLCVCCETMYNVTVSTNLWTAMPE